MTSDSKVVPISSPVSDRAIDKKNIYLVASGKGGVGKTWFTVTLAHALAKAKHRVVIFDGDLGLANIDIQLGISPERDLSLVIAGKMGLSDIVTSYETGGFDVIAGCSGSGDLADLPPQRLAMVKQAILAFAREYDTMLIDSGAGVGGVIQELTQIASQCFVVVTEEPTSITDAYAFVKLTHAAFRDIPIKIIINEAKSRALGEKTFEAFQKVCERFLNYKPDLAGVIRYDSHVPDAIRHQTSLLVRFPHSDAAQDVEAVARTLLCKS